VKETKAGKVEVRFDKTGVIHVGVASVFLSDQKNFAITTFLLKRL